MKYTYGYYTCIKCGSRHRALIESLCYKRKICPKCLAIPLNISSEFDITFICGWKSTDELKKYYRR